MFDRYIALDLAYYQLRSSSDFGKEYAEDVFTNYLKFMRLPYTVEGDSFIVVCSDLESQNDELFHTRRMLLDAGYLLVLEDSYKGSIHRFTLWDKDTVEKELSKVREMIESNLDREGFNQVASNGVRVSGDRISFYHESINYNIDYFDKEFSVIKEIAVRAKCKLKIRYHGNYCEVEVLPPIIAFGEIITDSMYEFESAHDLLCLPYVYKLNLNRTDTIVDKGPMYGFEIEPGMVSILLDNSDTVVGVSTFEPIFHHANGWHIDVFYSNGKGVISETVFIKHIGSDWALDMIEAKTLYREFMAMQDAIVEAIKHPLKERGFLPERTTFYSRDMEMFYTYEPTCINGVFKVYKHESLFDENIPYEYAYLSRTRLERLNSFGHSEVDTIGRNIGYTLNSGDILEIEFNYTHKVIEKGPLKGFNIKTGMVSFIDGRGEVQAVSDLEPLEYDYYGNGPMNYVSFFLPNGGDVYSEVLSVDDIKDQRVVKMIKGKDRYREANQLEEAVKVALAHPPEERAFLPTARTLVTNMEDYDTECYYDRRIFEPTPIDGVFKVYEVIDTDWDASYEKGLYVYHYVSKENLEKLLEFNEMLKTDYDIEDRGIELDFSNL